MHQLNQKIKFIYCHLCGGRGIDQTGKICPVCSGIGLGAFASKKFFYWEPIKKDFLNFKTAKNIFSKGLDLCLYLIGALGFISIAVWLVEKFLAGAELNSFVLWQSKSPLIFIFWIGIIVDMFLFYCRYKNIDRKNKWLPQEIIDPKKYPHNWDELKTFSEKSRVDIFSFFSSSTLDVIKKAFNSNDAREIRPINIFLALTQDEKVSNIFSRLLGEDKKRFMEEIDRINKPSSAEATTGPSFALRATAGEERKKRNPFASIILKENFIKAYLEKIKRKKNILESQDLLLHLARNDQNVKDFLARFNLNEEKLEEAIEWFEVLEKTTLYYNSPAYTVPGAGENYQAVATPILNHFSNDLTYEAECWKLDMCIDRKEETKIIKHALENNRVAVLVGPKGSGKNIIIEKIAHNLAAGKFSKILADKRLIEIDWDKIKANGESNLIKDWLVIIDDAVKAGNIILYINNVKDIFAREELATPLIEVLEKKYIQIIISASEEDYIKYLFGKVDSGLIEKILIKELSLKENQLILASKINEVEMKHKIYFTLDAVKEIINTSRDNTSSTIISGKAVELLSTVAEKIAGVNPGSVVVKEDVARVALN
jgi:ATP-dependent Clp protease ATP-binding subunit ClpA